MKPFLCLLMSIAPRWVVAFQPRPTTTMTRTILFSSSNDDYTSILDDGHGHIRSDLATSIWNWDHDHYHHKFQYSTRKGLKLVDEIARDLLNQNNHDSREHADLIQEGVVALMHAMATYNNTQQDDSFESFAKGKITTQMSTCLAQESRPIRLPPRIYEALQKAQEERVKLELDGQEASMSKIATRVGLSQELLELYQLLSGGTVSVESTVELYDPLLDAKASFVNEEEWNSSTDQQENNEGDDEMWVHQEQLSGPLRDVIVDHTTLTPDDWTLQSMMQHDVDDLLTSTLTKTELQVIRYTFGLNENGGQAASLTYMANQMDLSKPQIVNIQQRAMEKLQTAFSKHYVETYLDDEHESIVDSV